MGFTVTGSAATAASAQAISVSAPAGITLNDIIFIWVYGPTGNITFAPDVGSGKTRSWTFIGSSGASLYYTFADAIDASTVNYVVGWSGSATTCAIDVVRVSGATLAPIDGAATAGSGSSASPLAPSVTPINTADLLLNFYYGNAANAITVPNSAAGSSFGNGRSIAAGYETLSAAGATGTRTASCTSMSWYAVSQALRQIGNPAGGVLELSPILRRLGGNTGGKVVDIMWGNATLPSPGLPAGNGAVGSWVGRSNSSGMSYAYAGEAGLAKRVLLGGYYVKGHTYEGNISVPIGNRRVFICPRNAPDVVIAEAYTGSNGYFAFYNLTPGLYDVYAVNPDNSEEDVIHGVVSATNQ